MGKYLDKSGLRYFYGKLKEKFADKTTIEAKLDSLTGAFLWKGKFDTLPPVYDYEAGNVVAVGKKEYVLTVTGGTKSWDELGDEGSYLLKTAAEETYLKKAAGEVKTANLADNAVTKEKIKDQALPGTKLYNYTITNDQLAYDSVRSCNIVAGAVTGDKIYDDAITTPKIVDGAVTTAKVADSSITSSKLSKGARNPIILTPDTTEVDEKTYQKLLSDDVDVMFKTSTENANLCTLTYKSDNVDYLALCFTCFSVEDSVIDGSYLYAYRVDITKTSPHTCSITENQNGDFESFLNSRYLQKSDLNPILQEIDLTGTDADRKAKLDKFEADWKALTGTVNPRGARFIGKVNSSEIGVTTVLLCNNINNNTYEGIIFSDDFSAKIQSVSVDRAFGSITITPLFSHLEAVTIQTDNTPESNAANVAAIKAYVDNLIALGVDVTKGYMIPICFSNTELGYVMYHPFSTMSEYTGIITGPGGASSNIAIEKNGYAYVTTHIQPVESSLLTTTAKTIVPAINEVNALAKSKQDTLTSGTNIKTVNGQSLLGSGDIAISGGGGSAPVLVNIDDISGSIGSSVSVDVFNTIANAASAKTPIFGYSELVEGSKATYEIIPLYVKNISTTTLSIQFVRASAYNSVLINRSSDTKYIILLSVSRTFALDTSVDKSSTKGVQSNAVWNEIHSEPMTVNTATSGVTILSSTDKHKILCYADSGTQQYNLPPSPVDGETFLFLKVKSGHTITISSGIGNQNIYDCSSGNSVVSKTIETSTKRKITVTYSSTVGKWLLMANDFLS